MVVSLPKQITYKNTGYLLWAHRQQGICCLCRRLHGAHEPAQELHHFGDKGMGQKCNDYEIARVCRKCHDYVQGKRRAYFVRTNEWEVLAAMQEDALELLMAWSERGASTTRSKNADG